MSTVMEICCIPMSTRMNIRIPMNIQDLKSVICTGICVWRNISMCMHKHRGESA